MKSFWTNFFGLDLKAGWQSLPFWQWEREPKAKMKAPADVNPPDADTPFMYIFVREDLPPVVKLIQVAHVTHKAGARFQPVSDIPLHFCVFGVKDEQALQAVAWQLKKNAYQFEIFSEPDFETGDTAIAVQPLVGAERDWFQAFQLLMM